MTWNETDHATRRETTFAPRDYCGQRWLLIAAIGWMIGGGISSAIHAQTDGAWRGPMPPEGEPWPTTGHFFHRYWFQMGDPFANPPVNGRFRVNDPYVATHPTFHARDEPKGNGMMLIPMRQSLREIKAARLYLELWGGHPHSTNRRVTVNGRSTYRIDVPSDDQCTHAYRTIPLKITDLVQGLNAVQFAVDGDQTFWGHFIVEEAAIDALLPLHHPATAILAASEKQPTVRVKRASPATIGVQLDAPQEFVSGLTAVHFFAFYEGFDENGDGVSRDWHGMTWRKQPYGHLGTVTQPPYAIDWDTSMLVAQENVRVRALLEFRGESAVSDMEESLRRGGNRYWKAESLYYQTDESEPVSIRHPDGVHVVMIAAAEQSVPFWSRDGRVRTCAFDLPDHGATIERAMLQTCVWDGGAGAVREYFRLNDQFLPIAGDGSHTVKYSTLPVEPSLLKPGRNLATLLSDTEHHGIEILYPGPVLTVRYRQ